MVDDNGDGIWDAAIALYSFAPNEKVTVQLSAVPKKTAVDIVPRAHVRLRKKVNDSSFGGQLISEVMPFENAATDFSKQPLPLYLTEGPAWENDRVGFRLYFDVRNGKDIWGKTTSQMVLDSVGVDPKDNYHRQASWGMDILKVGKSLGAGALALSIPQPGKKDTLVRLGGSLVRKAVYTQLADGPLLARFKMQYDCFFNGLSFRLTETTSLWGGQFFYESRVDIDGAPAGTKLVIGLPNLYPNEVAVEKIKDVMVLYSHGRQSENNDNLGLALMTPQNSYINWQPIKNPSLPISDTYTIAQKVKKNSSNVFRFYAAWEQSDKRFDDRKYFAQMLQQEALRFSVPIEVKLQ